MSDFRSRPHREIRVLRTRISRRGRERKSLIVHVVRAHDHRNLLFGAAPESVRRGNPTRHDRRHRRGAGAGLARALLDAATDRLVALGAGRLDAMVLEENGDAHRLWEAAGYAPQPRWRRWVRHVELTPRGR